MTSEHRDAVATLLRQHIVPVLERWDVAVVDGGTNSGVMQLMGDARVASHAGFALIGVTARATVALSQTERSDSDKVTLEPHHTHVLLVPGNSWGDESPWLTHVATVVADGQPSATLVVNGGDITYDDIANGVAVGRPALVLAGTGRTADAIAAAATGETADDPTDERATRLAASPLVRIVGLDDPDGVTSALQQLLAP